MSHSDTADADHTLEPVERATTFTDAVVAIALTLLALPLLESTSEFAQQDVPVSQWASEHWLGFVWLPVSFAIITGYWRTHERIFRHARRYSGPLHRLNVLWMLSIVVLPVFTALLSGPPDTVQVSLYIGCLIVSAGCLAAMALLVGRAPATRVPASILAGGLASVVTSAAALVAALVLLHALPAPTGVIYVVMALHLLDPLLERSLTPVSARLLGRG